MAAEREARAASDRGFDRRQAVPLLAQSMLSQQKEKDLLAELQPDGKDAALDASILVARGYAQIALKNMDEAQASFALAEKTAPNAVEPLLASARLLSARGDLEGAKDKIDRAINAQPKSPEALLAKAEVIAHQGRRNRLACRARPDADRSAGQHAGVAGPRRTADRHGQARQGEGRP